MTDFTERRPHERAEDASLANIYPHPTKQQPSRSPEYAQALRAYREREREIRDEFGKDLAKDYLPEGVPDGVADDAFRLAWDWGHSSGYRSVEDYYEDIASLVSNTWKAAKE